MRVLIDPSRSVVDGVVKAPPSKSYTHRALFASLLASSASTIKNILVSGDTKATLNVVKMFGASIRNCTVRPPVRLRDPLMLYCRGSGTTLRIATAVAALTRRLTVLYGSRSLNRRPMLPLLEALATLGAQVVSRGGLPPVAVKGFVKPRRRVVNVDCSASSQFATALLMIAPVVGLTVKIVGPVKSAPYIDVTVRVMKKFGARVDREGYRLFKVEETGYRGAEFTVPGDYSSASFIAAVAALKGRAKILNLWVDDVQGDRAIVDVIRSMGARVYVGDSYVEVEASGGLEGVEVDCSNTPDLALVVAVLGACARGFTRVTGVEHLVYKESNRLMAVKTNLEKMGARVRAGRDYIEVRGGRLKGCVLRSFGDHRVAMAFTVAALGAEGESIITGFEKVSDSYPWFLKDLKKLGVFVEEVAG